MALKSLQCLTPTWWHNADTRPLNSLKKRIVALALCCVSMIGMVQAREVTLTTMMSKKFRGVGAYIVIYITDTERENYQKTLWFSGRSARYVGQFRHWWRATERISKHRLEELDGISGPSLAGGEELSLSVDIADELFDAGFVVRIDSTVQEGRDYPSDVVLPLSSEMSHKPVEGRGYVGSLTIGL